MILWNKQSYYQVTTFFWGVTPTQGHLHTHAVCLSAAKWTSLPLLGVEHGLLLSFHKIFWPFQPFSITLWSQALSSHLLTPSCVECTAAAPFCCSDRCITSRGITRHNGVKSVSSHRIDWNHEAVCVGGNTQHLAVWHQKSPEVQSLNSTVRIIRGLAKWWAATCNREGKATAHEYLHTHIYGHTHKQGEGETQDVTGAVAVTAPIMNHVVACGVWRQPAAVHQLGLELPPASASINAAGSPGQPDLQGEWLSPSIINTVTSSLHHWVTSSAHQRSGSVGCDARAAVGAQVNPKRAEQTQGDSF